MNNYSAHHKAKLQQKKNSLLFCQDRRQEDLWVLGQSGQQSKFQDSKGYREKSCVCGGGSDKKQTQKNKKTNFKMQR